MSSFSCVLCMESSTTPVMFNCGNKHTDYFCEDCCMRHVATSMKLYVECPLCKNECKRSVFDGSYYKPVHRLQEGFKSCVQRHVKQEEVMREELKKVNIKLRSALIDNDFLQGHLNTTNEYLENLENYSKGQGETIKKLTDIIDEKEKNIVAQEAMLKYYKDYMDRLSICFGLQVPQFVPPNVESESESESEDDEDDSVISVSDDE